MTSRLRNCTSKHGRPMIICWTICLSFIRWSFKTASPGGQMVFLVTVRLSSWRCSRKNPAKRVFKCVSCIFVNFHYGFQSERHMYLTGKMDSLIHSTASTVLISLVFHNHVPVISGMPLLFKSLSFVVHRAAVSVQFPLSLEIPMIWVGITLTLEIRLTISFSIVATWMLWREKPMETLTTVLEKEGNRQECKKSMWYVS